MSQTFVMTVTNSGWSGKTTVFILRTLS